MGANEVKKVQGTELPWSEEEVATWSPKRRDFLRAVTSIGGLAAVGGLSGAALVAAVQRRILGGRSEALHPEPGAAVHEHRHRRLDAQGGGRQVQRRQHRLRDRVAERLQQLPDAASGHGARRPHRHHAAGRQRLWRRCRRTGRLLQHLRRHVPGPARPAVASWRRGHHHQPRAPRRRRAAGHRARPLRPDRPPHHAAGGQQPDRRRHCRPVCRRDRCGARRRPARARAHVVEPGLPDRHHAADPPHRRRGHRQEQRFPAHRHHLRRRPPAGHDGL